MLSRILYFKAMLVFLFGFAFGWGEPQPLKPGSGGANIPLELAKEVEQSISRGLAWLASRQERNGRFPTHENGQPAVTALCLLAFLANGHLPGDGPYGKTIKRGIEFC